MLDARMTLKLPAPGRVVVGRDLDAYEPAGRVELAAAETRSLTLAPREGQRLGFDRLLVTPTDAVELTAYLGGHRLFRRVQARAVQRLFGERALLAPLVIEQEDALELQATNLTATAQPVAVKLAAYPPVLLAAIEDVWRQVRGAMPTAQLLSVTGPSSEAAHDAGAAYEDLSVRAVAPSGPADLYDARISLSAAESEILRGAPPALYERRLSGEAPFFWRPPVIGAGEVPTMRATSAGAHGRFSALIEAYETGAAQLAAWERAHRA